MIIGEKCVNHALNSPLSVPCSQSAGPREPVVTPSGDIQMQTFSVTNKVHTLGFFQSLFYALCLEYHVLMQQS